MCDAGLRPGMRDEGFTILEMLIVTSLLTVAISAGWLALQVFTKVGQSMDARQQASEQNRVTLDNLTRELRQAVEVSEGDGVFATAQPRACSFYSDVTRDGVPDLVSYRVNGGWLYRQVTYSSTHVPPYVFSVPQAETVVVKSIDPAWSGDIFTYWDNADPAVQVTAVSHITDISAVAIRLLDKTTVGQETATVDFQTWVKIRSVHNTID